MPLQGQLHQTSNTYYNGFQPPPLVLICVHFTLTPCLGTCSDLCVCLLACLLVNMFTPPKRQLPVELQAYRPSLPYNKLKYYEHRQVGELGNWEAPEIGLS